MLILLNSMKFTYFFTKHKIRARLAGIHWELTVAMCDSLVVSCFHCSFHRSTAGQGSDTGCLAQCRPISLSRYGNPSAIPRNVTASKPMAY